VLVPQQLAVVLVFLQCVDQVCVLFLCCELSDTVLDDCALYRLHIEEEAHELSVGLSWPCDEVLIPEEVSWDPLAEIFPLRLKEMFVIWNEIPHPLVPQVWECRVYWFYMCETMALGCT